MKNKPQKTDDYIMGSYNDYKGLHDPTNTVWYTLGSFLTNWKEMKEANTEYGLIKIN